MTAGAPSLSMPLSIPKSSSNRERSQSMRSNISRRWVVSHDDPLQDGLQKQRTFDVQAQHFPTEHKPALESGSPPRTRYHKGEFRMREEENGGRLVLDLDYEENSDSKTDSSTDAASPSIRTRQRSVTTTATSVNSARCSSLSHKPHVSMNRAEGASWVDLEPDIWDSEPALALERPLTTSSPSKRPHTSSGAPLSQKRISEHSIVHVPKRRSSLSHRVTYLGDPSSSRPNSGLISFAPLPDLSFDSNAFQQYSHRRNISSISRHPDDCFEDDAAVGPVVSTHRLPIKPEAKPPSPPQSVTDDDHVTDLPQSREPQLRDKPALPNKDMPGLVNIQAWLESSGELAVASPLRVKQIQPSSGIRVPPEIMETLRVSITNFPETMLLTSSLTIETIRSYSKKLKRSSSKGSMEAPFSIPSLPTPPSPTSTKRWKFPKLLSSRFGNGSSKSNSPARDDDSSHGLDFGSTASATSTPNWAPIRNIFPLGSDYLCDALYAHLIAYNYLASICPMDCTGPREKHIRMAKAGLDDDGYPIVEEDPRRVPKKAASLLGLSRAAAASSSTTDLFQIPRKPIGKQHKRLLSLGGDKKNGGGAGPESALADLRDGLAKCVANLISTLKLTGGGEQDAPILTDGLKDLDPLLLRSLCEVVRCCEE